MNNKYLLILCLGLASLAGRAGTLKSWTGAAGDGMWFNATNWSITRELEGFTVPCCEEEVYITKAGSYTVTRDAIGGEGTIHILGGSSGTQTLVLDAGLYHLVVQQHGVLHVNADGGVGGFLTNWGQVDFQANSKCSGWVENMPGAMLDIQGDIWVSGGDAVFNNAGTFRKSSGTGEVFFGPGVTVTNTGSMDVQSGSLRFLTGLTSSGTINVASGASNVLGGGVFNFKPGHVFSGSGVWHVGNPVAINGDLNALFEVDWGVVTFDARLLGGTINWLVSSHTLYGTLTIGASGLLQLGNAGYLGGTVTNYGRIVFPNTGSSSWDFSDNARLVNQAGGLVDVQGDKDIYPEGTNVAILNAGTWRKSGGAGTSAIALHWAGWSLPFTNLGSVEAQKGTISFESPYAETGTASLGISIAGTNLGSQYGHIQFQAPPTFAGKFVVTLANGFIPAAGDRFNVLSYPSAAGGFSAYEGLRVGNGLILWPVYSATNLSLVAGPAGAPPSLAVQYPQNGTRVQTNSNKVTVRGTASIRLGPGQVLYQWNGAAWQPASGTTNWQVTLDMQAGANTFRAYALDALGNPSATNTVVFTNVVTASLALVINPPGGGTVSGVTNGQWLEINRAYTATAKSNGLAGFAFKNWTQTTNGTDWATSSVPLLHFTMQTNLTLQANFVDVAKPTLAITAPTANQRWSNAVFTVKGTAKDNVHVSKVWCLTNGVWGLASHGVAGTNWSIAVTLTPGTNVVKACAQDAALNWSVTQSVSFVYVVSDVLKVQATGPCAMLPNYSNAVLEIGKSYTTTVTPAKGFVFSNWVGTVLGNLVFVGNTSKLSFMMQSNLVLQANVISNPFIPAKGTYNGLFAKDHPAQENSGFASLTLSDNGKYSGNLKRGTDSYPFTGQFDVGGRAVSKVSRPGTNAWGLTLEMHFATPFLQGWVSNSVAGGWVASLLALRAGFDARTNRAADYMGKYTLSIPGGTNADGSVWLGDSYLTLSVDPGGKTTYSGWLADGTAVGPASAPVSEEGFVPLYVALYGGKGSLWSWLVFDSGQPATGLEADLSWIKLPKAGAYYPAGFTNRSLAAGARYTPPTNSTTRFIEMTNGMVSFEGGNLSLPLTNAVMLTQSNKVIDLSLTNKLSLTLTLSNGVFTGSVREPGVTKSNLFKGVLLQDENSGYGYFLETNRSGRVLFWPVP